MLRSNAASVRFAEVMKTEPSSATTGRWCLIGLTTLSQVINYTGTVPL